MTQDSESCREEHGLDQIRRPLDDIKEQAGVYPEELEVKHPTARMQEENLFHLEL